MVAPVLAVAPAPKTAVTRMNVRTIPHGDDVRELSSTLPVVPQPTASRDAPVKKLLVGLNPPPIATAASDAVVTLRPTFRLGRLMR